MNYFEHHIGDYLKDTAHLALLEHGIYRRLMDVYYTREEPLPADCGRLIGARSRDEKAALKAVLDEFFEPAGDGWSHRRCDAEIARFKGKREKAKASADARWSKSERNANADADGMRTHEAGYVAEKMRTHGERNATGAEAPARSQSPVTSNQTQTPEQGARPDATTLRALAEGTAEPEDPAIGAGTRYGLAARAMRQKGCAATPGDPRLRQLVDQGASLEEFEAVGAEAADKGKGPAWALTALINRRKDAEQLRLAPAAAPPAWHETRDGVSARGQQLGIGAWQDVERASIAKGVSPRYDAYRKRVLEADEADEAATESTR